MQRQYERNTLRLYLEHTAGIVYVSKSSSKFIVHSLCIAGLIMSSVIAQNQVVRMEEMQEVLQHSGHTQALASLPLHRPAS